MKKEEKEIKALQKQLTNEYRKLVESKDFPKRLGESVLSQNCLICHNLHAFRSLGICGECAQFVDKDLTEGVEKKYRIELSVEVKKR